MTQEEFLEQNVFTGLTKNNENNGECYFSEEDFSEVLKQCEHFGIAIYDIKATINGEDHKTINHDMFRKKATDVNWYKREFSHLKREQEDMQYAATYKVSKKLLAR
ncbi:hypothetical protein [Formosa sp. PL04]|uniref:hypothetical protein n=1 Tax=Formosa sp. PL04 TaxID=3081755 RepID=UPI002980C08C|nr:hypothetical protein [Formosa sp. PL04]MDW5287614.1 hypothetical protein [Formosa sp. PL04]